MIISMIVARAANGCIGKNNELPWKLSGDLKKFKELTMGHHMIMGSNTFKSIGKALPGRVSLVLSRSEKFEGENIHSFNEIHDALGFAHDKEEEEVFIIGGAKIYEATLDMIDCLYLTEVDTVVEGDAFFPELDMSEWEVVEVEAHEQDDKNQFPWTFKKLERILLEDLDPETH